ncbi:glycosyltransferase [Allopusillimonas ginsengisoli]|uniref:glycosyltransferase n=1 Tax=Allopusillimonas ginsengisoli TaxID=453575 RepID=UPI001021AA50|nr:glycosyltransferase [Allopusillimonas ginsengisoli]TEA69612.1 glycosyltransferase [Allopusillimonas ginsengisoli]
MKILHVYKVYYPDAQSGVAQMIRHLAQGGDSEVEHAVFALSTVSTAGGTMQKLADVSVYRPHAQISLCSTPISFTSLGMFSRAVKQADLIHYHFPWPFADVLHYMARVHKPAVVTYHSDIVKQSRIYPFYRPLMRKFLGGMRAVIATSPNYARTSEVLGDYAEKTVVIPIGLDPTVAAQPVRVAAWRAKLGDGFFLFVGGIRYYKGLHYLLDAARGARFRVVIAGDGPHLQNIRQQAARHGLDNVHFLGEVSDEDKSALYELCRGVVFPSHLRSEAFGVTLVEGAMFGKPLISAEIGTGTSYVNIHGVTGLVVPASDPHALRTAVSRLHSDPALATRLGHAARERYADNFTASLMRKRYKHLYHSVLA